VDPVTVSAIVSRPPEVVYDYLADIANHAEFCDHWLVDWRLTREDSYGRGAGARFKVRQRLNRFPWMDSAIVEALPPRRLVLAGRAGKLGRIKLVTVWSLELAGRDSTRVTFTTEAVPVTPAEKMLEVVWGTRAMTRRRAKRALGRLQAILEEGKERGTRASIAGGARKPATGTPIR
jgi:uncharacterized protein YndB with AHSA1/START domain